VKLDNPACGAAKPVICPLNPVPRAALEYLDGWIYAESAS
jgi:hypothetical protein